MENAQFLFPVHRDQKLLDASHKKMIQKKYWFS